MEARAAASVTGQRSSTCTCTVADVTTGAAAGTNHTLFVSNCECGEVCSEACDHVDKR